MPVVAIIASLVPAVLATIALIVYVRSLRVSDRSEGQTTMWWILGGYGLLMTALAGMELAVLVPALNR